MKLLFAALMCFSVLTSCSTQPSRAFEASGFDERSVITGTLLDQESDQRLTLPKGDVGVIVEEMRGILPPRTAVVDPRYVVGLFNGSSFQSQKVELFIDMSGEGCFKCGTGRAVMFYSPTLYGTLNSIATKLNKSRHSNRH